jgi:hypothetical protein
MCYIFLGGLVIIHNYSNSVLYIVASEVNLKFVGVHELHLQVLKCFMNAISLSEISSLQPRFIFMTVRLEPNYYRITILGFWLRERKALVPHTFCNSASVVSESLRNLEPKVVSFCRRNIGVEKKWFSYLNSRTLIGESETFWQKH